MQHSRLSLKGRSMMKYTERMKCCRYSCKICSSLLMRISLSKQSLRFSNSFPQMIESRTLLQRTNNSRSGMGSYLYRWRKPNLSSSSCRRQSSTYLMPLLVSKGQYQSSSKLIFLAQLLCYLLDHRQLQ